MTESEVNDAMEVFAKLWPKASSHTAEIMGVWRSILSPHPVGEAIATFRDWKADRPGAPLPSQLKRRRRAAAAQRAAAARPGQGNHEGAWHAQRWQWRLEQAPGAADIFTGGQGNPNRLSDIEIEARFYHWQWETWQDMAGDEARGTCAHYWRWQDAVWRQSGGDAGSQPLHGPYWTEAGQIEYLRWVGALTEDTIERLGLAKKKPPEAEASSGQTD